MKDDKVIISLEKVPVRRALKRSNKKVLLLFLVVGVLGGYVYSMYFKNPSTEAPTSSAGQAGVVMQSHVVGDVPQRTTP